MDTMRRMRRLVPVAVLSMVSLASCDPCTGTVSCRVPTHFAINGQIVGVFDGRGIDGIQIDAIHVSGVAANRESLSTRTSNGGFFRFDVGAPKAGNATFQLIVHTPRLDQPYRVPVNVRTHDAAGDADVLDRWVAEPYFPNYLELFRRGTADDRIASTRITFTRTSGAQLSVPVFSTTTDVAGRAVLFQFLVFPRTYEPVTGNLLIEFAPPLSPETQQITLMPTHLYRPPPGIVRLAAGP
jgi:hypothetical protein